jgi:hypothetical protein
MFSPQIPKEQATHPEAYSNPGIVSEDWDIEKVFPALEFNAPILLLLLEH